jgi:hypothetical protein
MVISTHTIALPEDEDDEEEEADDVKNRIRLM